MPGYTKSFVRRETISPATLGLNGVVIANGAPVTSNTFSVEGFGQLAFAFSLTQVAATAVTAYLEYTFDGSTWFRQQSSSVSTGTETLSAHIISKAVSGSINWYHNFGDVLSDKARLVVTGTNGSTDTITVTGVVGVLS